MKALCFDGEKLIFENSFAKPVPPLGEALVRVLMSGICNTDIEITKGYMGFTGIPGHEFVGIVEEINAQDQSLMGKRVVGDINCACGQPDCEYCSKNLGRHCPSRTTLGISKRNGAFAEYLTLPVENLLVVPESVSNEMATLCEPLAAGFEILEQVDFSANDEVLIVGDGKLGLLINHAVSTTGAKITHVGKHPDKLELAKANGSQIVLLDQMPQKKYDIVIEATGSASGFNFSLSHTKPRGILVLKSTIASNQNIDMTSVVVNEITVLGSRCGLFQPALDYLAKGVDLNPLISEVFPFEKALEAFEAAKTRGAMKVMLRF
ncbi:MAG TPA: alcohol dehydrogenase catalytic domain-containing protein [Prolixibacteraceae bacterium]|nr:alcohol dehydrogenase catalytic domain-containing protein [Prolixibacteraceae bacterium]